jgi:hypothetical protein
VCVCVCVWILANAAVSDVISYTECLFSSSNFSNKLSALYTRILQGRVQTSLTAAAVAAVQHSTVHKLFKVYPEILAASVIRVFTSFLQYSEDGGISLLQISLFTSLHVVKFRKTFIFVLPQRRSASCPAALRLK